MRITFRRAASAAAIGFLAFSLGCERPDPRLAGLAIGIGKDSAIAVMKGPPTMEEPYLVNGKYLEALFYARPGEKIDSANRSSREMTPVVLVDGKLIGWGWDRWDSVAAANKISVPPKPKK